MNRLLKFLHDKYNIYDHIELEEDRHYVTLYIERENYYASIHIEYNSRGDWNAKNDDGHGGFEIGYSRTNRSITVHSVDYYKGEDHIVVSTDDFNNIETELNEQLQKYAS